MAYDEGLAQRIREMVPGHASEKKMFGGICWMDRGNMAIGITGDKITLRLNKEIAAEYRKEPHVAEMDFTGRPMPSMVYVLPEGTAEDADLAKWIERQFEFTSTLPDK